MLMCYDRGKDSGFIGLVRQLTEYSVCILMDRARHSVAQAPFISKDIDCRERTVSQGTFQMIVSVEILLQ